MQFKYRKNRDSVDQPRVQINSTQFAKKSDCEWKRNPCLERGGDSCTCSVIIETGGKSGGRGRKRKKEGSGGPWQEEKKRGGDLSSFLFFHFPPPSFLPSPLRATPFPPSSSHGNDFVIACLEPMRVTRKMLVPAYQEAWKATADQSTPNKKPKRMKFLCRYMCIQGVLQIPFC